MNTAPINWTEAERQEIFRLHGSEGISIFDARSMVLARRRATQLDNAESLVTKGLHGHALMQLIIVLRELNAK